MSKLFGTDGIRGIVNETFDFKLAYNCGNALGQLFPYAKILIGRDTRKSGKYFVNAFSLGAIHAGLNITNIGISPTAGICYLTKKLNFDFGVIISASHNPANYNGIKIVDANGEKINDKLEQKIENCFSQQIYIKNSGHLTNNKNYIKLYKKFLLSKLKYNFSKYKIVLDCANGTASKFAPFLFKKCHAKIIALNNKPNGNNINKNCGSTNINYLKNAVINNHANFGFAFDGDSDRVVAVDEQGNVIDGDKILYLFSIYYLQKKLLSPPKVVGTIMTNSGIEKQLNKKGITLIRTAVGDKNINYELNNQNLILGAETSGHIFNKKLLMTGDGILNALTIANICFEKNKQLSQFFNFSIFYQIIINVNTKNKEKILNNKKLKNIINKNNTILKNNGRVIVRASGTEPTIRIMIESKNKALMGKIANNLFDYINKINH